MADDLGRPQRVLSAADATAIIVGIVIGSGIFKFPSIVAGCSAGPGTFMLLWLAGGLISLIGALCYAELACAYPNAGGDYHFITRAFGPDVGFLFAWARLMVIQTGSIALLAFVAGDYATQLVPLGPYSSTVYAATTIMILTALNLLNVKLGKNTQNVMTIAIVVGLLLVTAAGAARFFQFGPNVVASTGSSGSAIGLAMVFVLLTYGGWNEAAYLSAEMRGDRRSILRALMWGIGIITVIYLLVNLAYLGTLGLNGLAASQAPGADVMRATVGPWGVTILSLIVILAALSTANATIFTGGRSAYALGRDFALFGAMGRWSSRGSTPVIALLVQCALSLALIAFGAVTRKGFETMVDYTAPVFWWFFMLGGLSLLVLRHREPNVERPFRVPLYPLLPLLFCAVCQYMLYSSLAYTQVGALVGVGVLIAGLPLLLVSRAMRVTKLPDLVLEES